MEEGWKFSGSLRLSARIHKAKPALCVPRLPTPLWEASHTPSWVLTAMCVGELCTPAGVPELGGWRAWTFPPSLDTCTCWQGHCSTSHGHIECLAGHWLSAGRGGVKDGNSRPPLPEGW
jgi:hypothetical protein